jgi:hypothetical protein
MSAIPVSTAGPAGARHGEARPPRNRQPGHGHWTLRCISPGSDQEGDREIPAEEQPDDDYHEEAPDWWMGKPQPDERIISYNLRKDERPGGMKVRYKIRVVSGPRAREIEARQVEVIAELLKWARQQRTQQAQ